MRSRNKFQNKNIIKIIIGCLGMLFVFGFTLMSSNSVFAAYDGEIIELPGGGGGGWYPYCVNLCTTYGATWQYYKYDYTSAGVAYNAKKDVVTMYGYPGTGGASGSAGYAATATLSGCKKYGGYWRYAMVSYAGGYFTNGKKFGPGVQVGTISINGGTQGVGFRSVKLNGGGMTFRRIPNKNCLDKNDSSKKVQCKWSNVEESYIAKGGSKWGNGTWLGAFCGRSNPASLTVNHLDIDTGKEVKKSSTIKNLSQGAYYDGVNGGAFTNSAGVVYRFLGWKIDKTASIVTRTSKDNAHTYVKNKYGGAVYNSGKNLIYQTVVPFMKTQSKNIYAMYTPIYWLTVSPGTGINSLTVSRTVSPYASLDNLSSGGYIFNRDTLKVCVSAKNKYKMAVFKINNTSYLGNSCVTYNVSGNTTVVASAEYIPDQQISGVCGTTGIQLNGENTQVKARVKNTTLASGDPNGSSGWANSVYAKPNDFIDWSHCYYVGAQKTTGTNGFTVSKNPLFDRSDDSPEFDSDGKYTKNFTDTNIQFPIVEEVSDSYTIPVGKSSSGAGNTLTETISSSYGGNVSEHADVVVPYNFDTAVEVETSDDEPLFAGEGKDISSKITIKPKSNSKTMKDINDDEEKYATVVGNQRYKLIAYKGAPKGGGDYANENICSYYGLSNDDKACGYYFEYNDGDEGGVDVNEYLTTENGAEVSIRKTFYAEDLSAGSRVCLAIAFFPANSGSDDNLDKNGSNTWRISDSKCYTIAKKPNMQLLGGNVYSVGYDIDTAVSAKNNVAGVDGADYHISRPNNNTYVFGSWGELGVISVGSVNGLASGAGTGYSGANLAANPGGSLEGREIDFCKRSTLSFANSQCAYGRAGLLGENVSIGANEDRINVEKLEESSDAAEIDTEESDQGIIIKESRVSSGTNIVKSSGDIQISGNLYYDGTYVTLDSVPKIVIYAKGNIYINCNVENVDALLVAEETVVTCGDFNTNVNGIGDLINDEANSHQLKVYGAIIANRVIANRTYGAATGDNSIVPAEIINFDPTLYLWGVRTTGESSISGEKLKITSTKELSPRF